MMRPVVLLRPVLCPGCSVVTVADAAVAVAAATVVATAVDVTAAGVRAVEKK